jgi:hypothetical protein
MKFFKNHFIAITALLGATLLGFTPSAHAVPSYARQTGLACATCHTTYPELTAFGRMFKLNGYTVTGLHQIQSEPTSGMPGLKINEIPPLSAMLQLSATSIAKRPADTQNNSVGFPQEASLFFAGEIAEHLGSFVQMTYAQDSGQFEWDNTDIRYANQNENAVWGVTLNNSPSVQDVWNTTPAWGFPFASSGAAPTPSATTLIDGALAQDVAGIGGYGLFANHFYAELTGYRSAHQGSAAPDITSTSTIDNLAPYWRLAWQNTAGANYFMVGAYGMSTHLIPAGVEGSTDDYTDTALDAQYERQFGADMLALRGTYIHEKKDLKATYDAGGSSNQNLKLDTLKINGTYHIAGRYAVSLGANRTTGDSDATLYADSPANGSPDSESWILQGTYLPWQNVQISAQYTWYTKFNGETTNYDGNGRNASDNNALYMLFWLMW